jgi:DNA repair exonuclease SbcCD ATPase subunit
MEMVNRLVFEFDTVEEYDELIKLLIQLRSPKLSKDFKPTVIYEIMNSSLPSLSDEDLRPLTETIENMDQIKIHLDQLQRNQKAVHRFKAEYDRYNQFVLYEKAYRFEEEKRKYQELQSQVRDLEIRQHKSGDEVQSLTALISQLEHEEEALRIKERELRDHDAFKLEQRWIQEEQNRNELEIKVEAKEKAVRDKQSKEWQWKSEADQSESRKAAREKDIDNILEEMDITADEAWFHDHEFGKMDLKKAGDKEFDFTGWRRDAAVYTHKVKEGRTALMTEDEANRRYDSLLREQDNLSRKRDEAARNDSKAQETVESSRREYITLTQTWEEINTYLKLSDEDRMILNRSILQYGEGRSFGDIQQILQNVCQPLRDEINQEIAGLKHKRSQIGDEMKSIAKEMEEWKNKKEPEPPRDPQVLETRRCLTEAGIPFVSLYQAVDFREGVSEGIKANLETALEDMGILDAVIIAKKFRTQAIDVAGKGCDKILLPFPQFMTNNLTQYLKAVQVDNAAVTLEEIDDMLASILLYKDGQSFYIEEDGRYGTSILWGKARHGIASRFIGAESRKRYRLQILEDLRQQLDELGGKMDAVKIRLEELTSIGERLEQEIKGFPFPEETIRETIRDTPQVMAL